jgi:hypothetical protein
MTDDCRMLEQPLDAKSLRPLGKRTKRVVVSGRLSDDNHQRVSKLLKNRPDVTLLFCGRPKGVKDLRFLRYYPLVKRLEIDLWNLSSTEGIDCLSDDLRSFDFGPTKSKRLSLSFLERFTKLVELRVEGHTKDIEALSGLKALRQLHLRSVTVPNLNLVRSLKKLLIVTLKLGGTTELEGLSSLKNLRYFEAWQVRGLADLSEIAGLKSLKYLFLQNLAQVKELPSMRPLRLLRWVGIDKLKNLSDLSPISEAPNLEELTVVDMKQLPLEALQPFVGKKKLRAARIGLCSMRRNKEAEELLNLSTDTMDKFEAIEAALADIK